MKIRIVHKNMKLNSAQQLFIKIIHLLSITYLPDKQNLMSIKQLSRHSLKNCRACLGKFGHTNRKGGSICIFTWLYYIIRQKSIPNNQVVKFNWSIAFWLITQEINLFPDMTFDRMMTRTIMGKLIFRKSNDKVY